MNDLISELINDQSNIDDGFRIYADGAVKTATVTHSGNIGWCVIAKSIPAAEQVFERLFNNEFLKAKNIRHAMHVRDNMYKYVISSKNNATSLL